LTANVRVIAAADENLNAMVERGQFRRDLFFRLRVMSLEMPPLRERGSDAVLLAEQFLRQFSCQ
jgi:transcriptional regulator with GAF, ATPase, and Fis domain